MAEYPALPMWTDAYLADTLHLTTEQHGAYVLMMMTAWRTPECRLPDDDKFLARICRCTPEKWARLRPVMAAFWAIDDGFWSQKRLTKERKWVANVSEKRKAAALAKHLKDKETHDAHEGANGVQTGCTHTHTHLDSSLRSESLKKDSPIGESKEARRKASRLPQDWNPTASQIATAEGFGLPPERVEFEAQQFRDHWHGQPDRLALKVNWNSTWCKWMRKAADDWARSAHRRESTDPMMEAYHRLNRRHSSGEPGPSGPNSSLGDDSTLRALLN